MKREDAIVALTSAANWHKSSRSKANGCIEVGSLVGCVGVRDSKVGTEGPILPFASQAWAAFTAKAKAGTFDR